MTYPTRPFVVIDARSGYVLGDLPTARLIQAGGGEAYEDEGIWRLRDDTYDTERAVALAKDDWGGEGWMEFLPKYTRVRIAQLRECRGWDGTMPHLTEYGTTFVGGLCPQCDTWREEDRRARLDNQVRSNG
jgi:hypothetical protein